MVLLSLLSQYKKGANAWSGNGPEMVLFSSRRVGAGDVDYRQDRAETLVEITLSSEKSLHQQKEGELHDCSSHTGSLQGTSTR
jgi:hypothetical protein